MKLTQKALDQLKSRALVMRIAIALDFSEQWMNRLIAKNKDNGPLTTVTAVELLRESGLDEAEILEESKEVSKVA